MNQVCFVCSGRGRIYNGSLCPTCGGTGSVWAHDPSYTSGPSAPPADPDLTLATMIGIGLASYLAWKAYTVGFGSVVMDFAVPIGALFGTALLLSRMPWLLSIVRRIIKAALVIGLILLALWFFGISNGKG